MKSFFILSTLLSSSLAFAPTSKISTPKSSALKESFGFDFAEDQAENTPAVILGEANYKQWVGEKVENSFLNRQYDVVRRVRELDLLGLTAEYGILSKLEKNGLDLATLESLLPTIEESGALSIVGSNQQLLINGVAPLVVEGAPLLLPVVAGALEVGPPAFFLAAAAFAGLEGALVVNNVEVPFVGLPAGVLAGLLLVPLSVAMGGVGVFLSGLKK
mmetsp:Transcript_8405/g.15865  ORF Transcript_8405/g.15865 Transcript_8405/m.15865 type:complete len:217 (-) Transcript_8405:327-977(-)|eukprot:CAMPEP_0176490652 /NCGR_PEP_ID=MMETSP0200_2-20121128/7987_1 /TAXON_ID=947934 /ORGANISM="Chaetoceros sp., Strain GSL56" /LENGTH=216 /DNA_ID=CAMNT_0017887977 /DNA_START=111 /DNA_END=761 /DNA_ORIENTATION=-